MASSGPVFFVVNAITEAEELGLVCGGGTDLPLSSAGMKEAARTASLLAKKKLRFKAIFCSPLLRSIQMADFIHDEVPAKLRVIDELTERKLGLWEGVREDMIKQYKPLEDAIPAGESWANFQGRVANILEWLKKQPRPALVVAHPLFLRTLLMAIGQPDRILKPCEIIEFSQF